MAPCASPSTSCAEPRRHRRRWPRARALLLAAVLGCATCLPARADALPTLDARQWLAPYPAQGTLPDSAWRIGRVRGHARILVIEFPNLRAQGAAMNRIAALIEKAGAPRTRIVHAAELERLMLQEGADAATFYEGNDYRAAALARFFNLARRQAARLNPAETRLRRVLLEHGVLRSAHGALQPGPQALITFSATQPDDPATIIDESLDAQAQASIFEHELSHGVFFTDPRYRAHCWRFWRDGLNARQRAQWRSILAQLGYDSSDEELMVNETQALLMHTPDRRAFDAADYGLDLALQRSERARFARLPP